MATRTVQDLLIRKRDHRRALARRKSLGQTQLISGGMALLITGSLFTIGMREKHASDLEEQNVAVAQDISLMAKAAARYIVNNYPALESAVPTGRLVSYVLSCNNNLTTLQCMMPSSRSSALHSLIGDGYLMPERNNSNILNQQYVLVIARSTTPTQYNGETYYPLQAIVTTTTATIQGSAGTTLTDDRNASIASHALLPASFIPLTSLSSMVTNAPWLLANGGWGGAAVPGRVALSLDAVINQAISDNTIKRFNGGSTSDHDDRAQMMSRSLYMARDSQTGGNANICFCQGAANGTAGSYTGACAVPKAPDASTANSQDYNGTTPNNTCTTPTW